MTRSERNANPGNIRHGDQWQGLAAEQPDKDFCTFVGPEFGVRAMAKILLAYQDRHELRTLAGIISRWAPPAENDTSSYIKDVCNRCGVGVASSIDLHDPTAMQRVIKAIVHHENGSDTVTDSVIAAGIELAGVAA